MNASRAKRRVIRWMRYLDHTHSMSPHRNHAGYHAGHSKAYTDYMLAGRAAPNGIRVPWTRLSLRGDA